MKRFWALLTTMLVLFTLLSGCRKSDSELPVYEFTMEFISDLEGNILNEEKSIQLTLDKKGNFQLIDETDNKEWNGTYSLEKLESAWKLEMIFDENDTAITGVYGFRKYQDKTEIPSITISTEDRILSFIASR